MHVSQLLTEQLAELSGLALRRIETSGTVNVLYRLGDEMLLRLPRTADCSRGPEREAQWMPVFAPLVSLVVPRYVNLGTPTDE